MYTEDINNYYTESVLAWASLDLLRARVFLAGVSDRPLVGVFPRLLEGVRPRLFDGVFPRLLERLLFSVFVLVPVELLLALP